MSNWLLEEPAWTHQIGNFQGQQMQRCQDLLVFTFWFSSATTMLCSVCSLQNYLYGQNMLMLNYIAKSKHRFLHLLSSLHINTASLPAAETFLDCLFSAIFKLKGFFFLIIFMKTVMLAKMEISLVKISGFNYIFMSSIGKLRNKLFMCLATRT